MKRIVLLATAVAVMAVMMVAGIVPAFAKGAKGEAAANCGAPG